MITLIRHPCNGYQISPFICSIFLSNVVASEVAQYDINLPCAEGSPREAAKTNSLNETISQKQSDLLENAKFPPASDGTGSKLTLPPMPSLVKTENSNEVALNDSGLLLAMG